MLLLLPCDCWCDCCWLCKGGRCFWFGGDVACLFACLWLVLAESTLWIVLKTVGNGHRVRKKIKKKQRDSEGKHSEGTQGRERGDHRLIQGTAAADTQHVAWGGGRSGAHPAMQLRSIQQLRHQHQQQDQQKSQRRRSAAPAQTPRCAMRAEQLTFVANCPYTCNFDSPTPLLSLQRLRDECIAMHTEEHPYCKALIEAHLACLRLEGFNVSVRVGTPLSSSHSCCCDGGACNLYRP